MINIQFRTLLAAPSFMQMDGELPPPDRDPTDILHVVLTLGSCEREAPRSFCEAVDISSANENEFPFKFNGTESVYENLKWFELDYNSMGELLPPTEITGITAPFQPSLLKLFSPFEDGKLQVNDIGIYVYEVHQDSTEMGSSRRLSLPETLVLVVLGKDSIDFADITNIEPDYEDGSIIIPSRGQEVYGLSFIYNDTNTNQEIIWDGVGVNFDSDINDIVKNPPADSLSLAGFTPSQIQFPSNKVSRDVEVSVTLRSKGQEYEITRDVSVSRNTAFSLFTLNRTYNDVDLYDVELGLVVDEVDLVAHSTNEIDFNEDNDADFVERILARSGEEAMSDKAIEVGDIVSSVVCQGSGSYQFVNYHIANFDRIEGRGVAGGIQELITPGGDAVDATDPLNRAQGDRWLLNSDNVLSVTGELELTFLRYINVETSGGGMISALGGQSSITVYEQPQISFTNFLDRYCSDDTKSHPISLRIRNDDPLAPIDRIYTTDTGVSGSPSGFFTLEASEDGETYTEIVDIGDDIDVYDAAGFVLEPNVIYDPYLDDVKALPGFSGTDPVDSLIFRLTYHSTEAEDPAMQRHPQAAPTRPGEEAMARTLYCTATASTVFTIYSPPDAPEVMPLAAWREGEGGGLRNGSLRVLQAI